MIDLNVSYRSRPIVKVNSAVIGVKFGKRLIKIVVPPAPSSSYLIPLWEEEEEEGGGGTTTLIGLLPSLTPITAELTLTVGLER